MTEVEPNAPGYVRWAARTLENAGYETWAVGGAIRNTLLGLPSGDWDLTTRAPPKVVQRLFPRTVPVGVEHGTVGVLTRQGVLLEVTTFRKDVETYGRKASVEFADSLEEDLARRDFTVNAIAWHPLKEEFLDPFGGRDDLEEGLLRTVGRPEERFSEDYLRVLRCLRFSGRFRFRIDDATWRALRAAVPHLGILSPERVREELMKILSGDPRPSGALSLYRLSGVLHALHPELEAVDEMARGSGSWPGGEGPGSLETLNEMAGWPGQKEDLWVHSLLLTDAIPLHRPLLRLAALLHGVGVPRPTEDAEEEPGEWRRDVRQRGRERAAALMIRLRFSNQEIRTVTDLIQAGAEPPEGLDDPPARRRWLHEAGPDQLASLARLWAAGARLDRRRGRDGTRAVATLVRALRNEVRSGNPIRPSDLALDGRDLIGMGLKPGPRFKEILAAMMDKVLQDPDLNRKETLRDLVLEWLEEEGRAPA